MESSYFLQCHKDEIKAVPLNCLTIKLYCNTKDIGIESEELKCKKKAFEKLHAYLALVICL